MTLTVELSKSPWRATFRIHIVKGNRRRYVTYRKDLAEARSTAARLAELINATLHDNTK